MSGSAQIAATTLNTGTDTSDCTRKYSRSMDDDGTKDCDAGHILANRLGGTGRGAVNIFPQDASINRGAFAQFEDDIYDCIAVSGAQSALLEWSFTYLDGTRTKPNAVTYSVSYTGGSCANLSKEFTNCKDGIC
jgi:hypothetical protein